MTRIPPADPNAYSDATKAFLQAREEVLGFVPNSIKVMARRPSVGEAYVKLSDAVIFGPEMTTPVILRRMVQHMASFAAGCLYCQAHTAKIVAELSEDEQKMTQIWEFETNDLFSDAERAALRFAMSAAAVPNLVTDDMMAEMREHFTDDEIVELLACVSVMGFMNRWNDTLATTLEEGPRAAAEKTIGTKGWDVGQHG
ncbi:carboxymuconolactone decarboxylase family protein [Litoreibacter albidus]|uniref:carboxymuconolactone decarboxylase family protein n=1 Tax=Litoreibacter albidus TaxID=670155 RepID=UPI0037365739